MITKKDVVFFITSETRETRSMKELQKKMLTDKMKNVHHLDQFDLHRIRRICPFIDVH